MSTSSFILISLIALVEVAKSNEKHRATKSLGSTRHSFPGRAGLPHSARPRMNHSAGGRQGGGELAFCGQSGTYQDSGDLGQALTHKETLDGKQRDTKGRSWENHGTEAKVIQGPQPFWHPSQEGARRTGHMGKGGLTKGVNAFAYCRKFAMLKKPPNARGEFQFPAFNILYMAQTSSNIWKLLWLFSPWMMAQPSVCPEVYKNYSREIDKALWESKTLLDRSGGGFSLS